MKSTNPEAKEWLGPNFLQNCYCDAKYRYFSTTNITRKEWEKSELLEVPYRLEVLNNQGQWQQHPVVFTRNLELVVIHLMEVSSPGSIGKQLKYMNLRSIDNADLYEEAKRKGLTEGSMGNIKSFVREID